MNDAEKVKREEVMRALDFLISLEYDPVLMPGFGMTEEDCEKAQEIHADEIGEAISLLRAFGEQIKPLTLERMQRVFYSITNDERFLENPMHKGTVIAYLNEAWNGVGPWQM